ncbi:carbon-nitrogen hydrolase family protein [Planctomycetaceae bacterium SH139]
MKTTRIALANLRAPATKEESLSRALDAICHAATDGANIICFPECYVPGYRIETTPQITDQGWLDNAWSQIDAQAAEHSIGVVLGTERLDHDGLRITARVTNPDGSLGGFQDKVQLDPSEESTYRAGSKRTIFQCGELTFGVVICHEGWRYPETTRWAAQNGAHLVFHPHFEIIENATYVPKLFADPSNSFHEKAMLCRAAENTCYFASVNCAIKGATTTSAVVDPDGKLLTHQPYGKEGLLYANIQLDRATRFLAKRLLTSFEI